ncbi:MAG: DUF559 domain-containing protein [bacterium]
MDKELLKDLYINKGMSIRQIAEYLGIKRHIVNSFLIKYEIPIRSKSEAISLRLKNTPRDKSTYKTGPREKRSEPLTTYNLTKDNWEIKNIDLRADRKNIPCLFVNGQRVRTNDKVSFICEVTGKKTTKTAGYFLENPVLKSKGGKITESNYGRKMSDKGKKSISDANSGEKIKDYFEFTCPICNKTYQYRNIHRNRIKKYCSKECNIKAWIQAPEYKGEQNKLEKYFTTVLDEMNLEYKSQYLIKYYMVDFFLEKENLIIQIDGDYWHVNPTIHPEGAIGERQINNIKVDKAFNTYIEKYTNYKLLRIWESDIHKNLDKVKEQIKKALQ